MDDSFLSRCKARCPDLLVDFGEWAEGSPYTGAMLRTSLGSRLRWSRGLEEGRGWVPPDQSSRTSFVQRSGLRVIFPAEGVTPRASGVQAMLTLPEPLEEAWLSYHVRFAKDFPFRRGGKLPGLCGGTGNTGGRVPDGLDGWSVRAMWRDKGQLTCYTYHPGQPGSFGENLFLDRAIMPGTWHQLTMRLRMNTPGRPDGRIDAFLDGEELPAATWNGLRFRDRANLRVDTLYFSTFFGGSDSSWAPGVDTFVDIEGIAVGRTRAQVEGPPPECREYARFMRLAGLA